MIDWYRRKTWTNKDKDEFFAKLKRARADGRAQYLKIQAIELVETKEKYLLDVAEELLNKVLTEYPESRFDTSSVLHTLGDIYRLRTNYEKALEYYGQSLAFEKDFPNVITAYYLDFSELVVKTANKNFYDVVEALLEDRLSRQLFPVAKYKMCSMLSIINHEKGNLDKAKYYHRLAEENATAETSGLHYHKHLGIVTKRDSWLERMKGRDPAVGDDCR